MTDTSTISLHDEAALSWYFGPGLSIYDRSTFGAIVAKLEADSCASTPCKTCDGQGILDAGGFNVENRCKTCAGDGRIGIPPKWCHDCKGDGIVADYEVAVDVGGWCPTCRGTGSTSVHQKNRNHIRCGDCGGARSSAACRNCSNCLGTGQEPLTAQPIHGGKDAAGVQADDSALTRFAITSRRVALVKLRSPALAEALQVYYGDVGQRWALTDRGRMFSLYHLTGAGKKLSRWGGRKGADLGLTAQERIGAEAALEINQPKDDRGKLLMTAGMQAVELYRRAARAWNDVSTSKRARQAWEGLTDNLQRLGYPELASAVAKHTKALP
jgi:hypothetical protein